MKHNAFLLAISILIASVVVGCARPTYLSASGTPGPSGDNKASTECLAQFSEGDVCLWWQWEKLPTQSETGVLIFKVLRRNILDQSLLPVDLNGEWVLDLRMPKMGGHPSTPSQLESVDIGSYRVKKVFFIMPGDWLMRFQLKSGNQIVNEAIVPISI